VLYRMPLNEECAYDRIPSPVSFSSFTLFAFLSAAVAAVCLPAFLPTLSSRQEEVKEELNQSSIIARTNGGLCALSVWKAADMFAAAAAGY